MSNIKNILYKKVKRSQLNNFGIENYDEYRFGSYPHSEKDTKKNELNIKTLKKIIKKFLGYNKEFKPRLVDDFIDEYLVKIEEVCENLSQKDKNLYISLITYRLLGYKRVKLPRNNNEYWKALEKAKSMADNSDTYDPKFLHFLLKRIDLTNIGRNIQIYFTEKGIAIDFIVEQYSYKKNHKKIITAEKGDVVLDLGGCWGDTALYFADKVGNNGKVYSFEFIPKSIEIFNMNISMNKNLQDRIELIEQPVTDKSNEIIYYKDNGPGSQVSLIPFPEQTGTCKTTSIDDLVKERDIKKVDFIKMDIEGAEMSALKGAEKTIKTYRPKLAIAIYHSMEDFVNIPNWILDLDYEIYIDHFSIHSEETICFAKPRK